MSVLILGNTSTRLGATLVSELKRLGRTIEVSSATLLDQKSKIIYDSIINLSTCSTVNATGYIRVQAIEAMKNDAYVAEWAMRTKQPHLVYLSSLEVLPSSQKPHLDYAPVSPSSKLGYYKAAGEAATMFFRGTGAYGLNLRVGQIYDPTDTDFGMIKAGRGVQVSSNPEAIKDYVLAEEVGKVIARCVERRQGGDINVSTGIGMSQMDFVDGVRNYVGQDGKISVVRSMTVEPDSVLGEPGAVTSIYGPLTPAPRFLGIQ